MEPSQEPGANPAGVAGPISVYVAEDESIIRLDLVETLDVLGFQVLGHSGRGDEAERQIRHLVPDVAILDVKMPGQTGVELAESLMADRVCACVIVSAFSQQALIDAAVDAGVFAYLLKPFQRNELSAQINVALARFRQLSDLDDELRDVNQRLADRVVMDRAKGRLIDDYGLGEAEAMRFLQQAAMNQRRPVRDIATDVLAGDLAP